MCRPTRAVAAMLAAATCVFGQSMAVPVGPYAPGATVAATLNAPPGGVFYLNGTTLYLLHPDGELVSPQFRTPGGNTWFGFTSTVATFTLPSNGPGSLGTYVLYNPNGVAAPIDVVAPSAPSPAIVSIPWGVHLGFSSSSLQSSNGLWRLLNVSAAPHVFGAGDVLNVYPTGGSAPIASVSLAGLAVPATGALDVPLPLGAMPTTTSLHYDVELQWNDPVVGAASRRHGVTWTYGADLHLPDGHVVPFGGTLRTYSNFAPNAVGTGPLGHALILSASAVPTPLGPTTPPGALQFPLAVDAFAIASVTGGLAPFLTNSPGTATPAGLVGSCGYCGPSGGLFYPPSIANGVDLVHPNLAILSGFTLEATSVAFSPAGAILGVSQVERITLG
ncbi:MAG TPA: hypothetical protein VEI02_08770 [Planctomycetota bacterium]|nr:hypothetical protein [Planctomycetota bacterium]